MRACLAILKDSFREAVASRILLVALVAILIVLALIAPFGLHEEKAVTLRRTEVPRADLLLEALADGPGHDGTPAAHLWSLLPKDQQERITSLLDPDDEDDTPNRRGPGGNSTQREVVRNINKLLEHDDFYDAAVWTDLELSDEGVELLARTDLSESESKRRNLLLLAAAFPRSIRIIDSTSLSIMYANATVVDTLPITPSQFETIFEQVLIVVITVFLGFFGVFASLLVTAGIIPRTFEPGEISLLLSKPVRRSSLFVTKFLGGCVFTLLYATVMVAGLWLLLGVRISYWNSALLWCIPVYVLLFMIYYAVSAVSGAVWRNSIVSLALVVCFWLGITVIGGVHKTLQDHLIGSRGIKEIISAGDALLVVNGDKTTYRWDAESAAWDEVFEAPPMPGMPSFARRLLLSDARFLPVYDATRQRLLALQQLPSRFDGIAPPELQSGVAADDWERVPLGRLPDVANTVMVSRDGSVILACQESILEFAGQTEKERQKGEFLSNLTAGLLAGGSKAFRELQPDDFPRLHREFGVAFDQSSDDLLIHSENKLYRMSRQETGQYTVTATRDLESSANGVIAAGGRHCLLATADGDVLLLNRESLETEHALTLPTGVLPRVCAAAPDGATLGVLTHDDTIILFDGGTGKPIDWQPPENHSCTAIAFTPEGKLLVSDGRLAVREYDVKTRTRTTEWSEQTTWVYKLYDYAIVPAWTILPKPSELDQFVAYVMTGDKTIVDNEDDAPPGMVNRDSLQQDRTVFDAWRVIRDNAMFVIVMLALGCFYVSRCDF
jgi:ABC-type transport system involved in multi-copper enzyme maturation permease subunit